MTHRRKKTILSVFCRSGRSFEATIKRWHRWGGGSVETGLRFKARESMADSAAQRLCSRALFALGWSLGHLIGIGLVGSLGPHQRLADKSANDGTAQCQHRNQEYVFLFKQKQQQNTDKAAQTETDDTTDDAA